MPADYDTAQRGQGGLQVTVRKVGHGGLGFSCCFGRRMADGSRFARHPGLGEFQ